MTFPGRTAQDLAAKGAVLPELQAMGLIGASPSTHQTHGSALRSLPA